MGARVVTWTQWVLLIAARSGRAPRTVEKFYAKGKGAVRRGSAEQIELAIQQLTTEGVAPVQLEAVG